ncbi:hypothetical protein KPL37_15570 [Clostridium frigoris]|uniref:Uncharacterized protein n=1 Tax=Clostridium frigoris TaxID=205327 RepID=A0ABS6BWS3_9CLOT|nr:hypothetical protein [Clostridium frigoris]MBU3161140.1 hypothetical protein [Clostridium frigoris]
MDEKEAKEFSSDAKYGITQMLTLIDDQTEEIEELKDKLEECKIQESTELYSLQSPECPTEEIEFDGESDFYEE